MYVKITVKSAQFNQTQLCDILSRHKALRMQYVKATRNKLKQIKPPH